VLDSDLLLMPSFDENHPLVLIEAIAASVPVVAYRAGASESIVGQEGCGLLSPIGDVRELGEHLERVLSDEALRFGFAEACFARRGELSSWERAASTARARLVGVV
jgi:glycosyltransferase involved in cell wall biosynthesis